MEDKEAQEILHKHLISDRSQNFQAGIVGQK